MVQGVLQDLAFEFKQRWWMEHAYFPDSFSRQRGFKGANLTNGIIDLEFVSIRMTPNVNLAVVEIMTQVRRLRIQGRVALKSHRGSFPGCCGRKRT